MDYRAEWTGDWPCLCYGKWKLFKDGKDVSNLIPKDKSTSPMKTKQVYSQWHFEDWMDVWEYEVMGLDLPEWVKENKSWLEKITDNPDEYEDIYEAFKEEDFVSGSCGGCI